MRPSMHGERPLACAGRPPLHPPAAAATAATAGARGPLFWHLTLPVPVQPAPSSGLLTITPLLLPLLPCCQVAGDAWSKTLEGVVRAVVVLKVTQTRAFDTEAAGSSYATGFVVDKARGLILTNRHVVTPGGRGSGQWGSIICMQLSGSWWPHSSSCAAGGAGPF